MKVFISWSGKTSNEIAKIVKQWLHESVFPLENISCFVSEEDIGVGADWLATIKSELLASECAIIVLTRNNINAPWLNFEAGSIAISHSDQKRAIPLLIDIEPKDIKSPLKHLQSSSLSKQSIRKLIEDIKFLGQFNSPSHIQDSIDRLYDELRTKIDTARTSVDEDYAFDRFDIFPSHIKNIKKGKVFVGIPMASADDAEYSEFKDCALRVKAALLNFAGAKEVYCPSESIQNRGQFDGYKKAIIKDFQILKESEHYVFIYPREISSSILVEMGYAIALSKNTTIFARSKNDLPFMLKKADTVIDTLEIHECGTTDEIIRVIESEGDSFLVRKTGK
ncbi:MAG: toll/interleukin-1 receptor domain-containing protein [Methylotenera sp.]